MKIRVFTMFSEDKYGIWTDVKGFEGVYAVSTKGYVMSLSRTIWNGKSYFKSKDKLIKGNMIGKGYIQVALRKNKKKHMHLIHKLVANAFIPNTENYPQINHKDGNKTNNNVENLEWCDNSQNQLHAWRTGLQKPHIAGKPMKSVRLYTNNESILFNSIAECARFLKENGCANLYRALKGKQKTIKGYKVEYV